MNQTALFQNETGEQKLRPVDEHVMKLRDSLGEQLNLLADRYAAAHHALQALEKSLRHDARLPWERSAVQEVFGSWLEKVTKGYEASGRGIGNACIEIRDLDERCQYPDKLAGDLNARGGVDVLRRAAQNIIAGYDFALLDEELTKHSVGLEQRGLVEAADKLACELGMNANFGRQQRPKKTARHQVLCKNYYPCAYGGYDHRLGQELYDVSQALSVAEEDAGLAGLSSGMTFVAEQFSRQRETFLSRTVIGKGSALEAVVFKEKIEFRISHDNGDGLLAFIAMYASVDLATPS